MSFWRCRTSDPEVTGWFGIVVEADTEEEARTKAAIEYDCAGLGNGDHLPPGGKIAYLADHTAAVPNTGEAAEAELARKQSPAQARDTEARGW